MALVLANRVQEAATANTTVSFTLSGAVAGFQSFAVIGDTNTTYYSATDGSGTWEVGLGTYSTTGPTLTRTTIYASSNSNLAATFSGAVNVFVTYPSGRSVNLDGSGNVSALGTVSSGTWQGSTIGVTYGGTGVTSSSGANSVVLRDSNENITVNRLNQGLQNITASGGVTILTAASDFNQLLTGTGAHAFRLPDATTLTDTTAFQFNNAATGILTVQNNAGTTVGTVSTGGAANAVLISNATVGGTWEFHGYLPEGVTWGTNALDLGTTVISNGTWQGGTIQSGYGGTGLTTFAGANNALYSTSASALAAGTLPVAAGGTGLTSYTINGVVYASGTGTLATGSALTFDGTNLINSGAYTAPSNGAGAGTKTTIRGSTGTGLAGASGGNGFIELIGGGGTSIWTSFGGGLGRRRGGINLQAGTAQADAGGTYVHGSNINITGSNATNNGTLVGTGSPIVLTSGSAAKVDGGTSGGAILSLSGGSSSSGGSAGLSTGVFSSPSGTNSGSQILANSATSTTGGDVRLLPGLASIPGSTSGKAYVTAPGTATNYEILTAANATANGILTTGNITTTAITAATANSVPYFDGSKVLTTGSALTFSGSQLTVAYSVSAGGVGNPGYYSVARNSDGATTGYFEALTGTDNVRVIATVGDLIFAANGNNWATLNSSGNLSSLSITASDAITGSRINPRTSTATATTLLTPDISAFDQYNLTAQNQGLTVNAPTGTPVDGNKLMFRIIDDGTPRSISWNATYTVIGTTLPTTTTANKMLYVGCIYNSTNTRWDVVAVTTQA